MGGISLVGNSGLSVLRTKDNEGEAQKGLMEYSISCSRRSSGYNVVKLNFLQRSINWTAATNKLPSIAYASLEAVACQSGRHR
jgi:hypothetical protein